MQRTCYLCAPSCNPGECMTCAGARPTCASGRRASRSCQINLLYMIWRLSLTQTIETRCVGLSDYVVFNRVPLPTSPLAAKSGANVLDRVAHSLMHSIQSTIKQNVRDVVWKIIGPLRIMGSRRPDPLLVRREHSVDSTFS